jgi:hypothetical protein
MRHRFVHLRQWAARTPRRLATFAVAGTVMLGGALAVGAGAQAAPSVQTALAPVRWSDYGQIITNYHSGKCLQPQSSSANAFVEQRTCNGSALQRWKVTESGTGYAWLVNQGSGLCMDLYANSEAEVVNGTTVQVFYCSTEYTTEQWARSRGSRLYHYQVFNRVKGLCLDVRNRSTSDGALLQVWSCSYYENAQQFKFTDG